MTVSSIGTGEAMSDDTVEITEDDLILLAQALPPRAPTPRAQARILARINARIAQAEVHGVHAVHDSHDPHDSLDVPDAHDAPGARTGRSTLHTLRKDDGHWSPMAPDVDVKLLHDDGVFASMLVRMKAGARLPPHGHPGAEECYVVSGDIWLSGAHLHAGDFQFADADVIHDDIHSEGGCLLHIRARSGLAVAGR